MNLKLTAAAMTHVGLVRRNNEDNFYLNGTIREDIQKTQAQAALEAPAKVFLAAVADGMGGEALGEVASLIAVKTLSCARWGQVEAQAEKQLQQANEKVCEEIRKNQGRRIGSTLVCLYIDEQKAKVCNLGDSRAYLLRGDELTCLTTDHTRAMQMVEMGILTQDEAKTHPARNELTRHLGIFEEEMIIEPEFTGEIELKENDVFLLCSDGLTDMLPEDEILHYLQQAASPKAKADVLIQAALAAGGKDNVTALVVQVQQDDAPPQKQNIFKRAWAAMKGRSSKQQKEPAA